MQQALVSWTFELCTGLDFFFFFFFLRRFHLAFVRRLVSWMGEVMVFFLCASAPLSQDSLPFPKTVPERFLTFGLLISHALESILLEHLRILVLRTLALLSCWKRKNICILDLHVLDRALQENRKLVGMWVCKDSHHHL